MLELWQNLPLHLNPVIFTIGNFSFRWYSLGYILALTTIYLFLRRQFKKGANPKNLTLDKLENILLFTFLGALLGGRIGYAILYDWSDFVIHPWQTLLPFTDDGSFSGFYGMSFHGGLIGTLLVGWLIVSKYKLNFYEVLNFIIPAFPLGYFWGRLGNFMNSELYGRVTESKIGMYFNQSDKQLGILRHPSQLYEALGEGLLLFLILQYCSHKKTCQNNRFPLFLIFYGLIRFLIEFFRQPDAQLGFVALGWITMGQVLCSLMIVVGIVMSFKNLK